MKLVDLGQIELKLIPSVRIRCDCDRRSHPVLHLKIITSAASSARLIADLLL